MFQNRTFLGMIMQVRKTATRLTLLVAVCSTCTSPFAESALGQGLNWEGQSGGFITPFAYTTPSPSKGFGRPELSVHYLDAGSVVGGITQASVTVGLLKRVEFGYTRSFTRAGSNENLGPLFEGGFNTVHGKVNLLPENAGKKKYVPAISAGFVARTQVRHVGGVIGGQDTSNGDIYLVATKTITQVKGLPLLVNFGFKGTNASLFGIAGNASA